MIKEQELVFSSVAFRTDGYAESEGHYVKLSFTPDTDEAAIEPSTKVPEQPKLHLRMSLTQTDKSIMDS